MNGGDVMRGGPGEGGSGGGGGAGLRLRQLRPRLLSSRPEPSTISQASRAAVSQSLRAAACFA